MEAAAGFPWAQRSQGDPRVSPTRTSRTAAPISVPPSFDSAGARYRRPDPGAVGVPDLCRSGCDRSDATDLGDERPGRSRAGQPSRARPAGRSRKLPLGSPSIEMAPPATSEQLVNVSTWLWINPAAWQAS